MLHRLPALALVAMLGAACGSAPATSAGLHQVAAIRVGSNAGILAFGFGSAWAPNSSDGTVSRIDLASNRVTATIRIGDYATYHAAGCDRYGSVHSYMVTNWTLRQCDQPTGIATGSGVVWVARNQDHSIAVIDPATDRVTSSIPLPVAPFQLASEGSELWVTSLDDNAVAIIDESSRRLVDTVRSLPQGPTGIAFLGGAAWVVGSYAGALTRIDLATHRPTATATLPCSTTCYSPLKPLAITAAFGALWVRNEGNATLARVDPRTLAVTSHPIDSFWGRDGLDSIAEYGVSLWVGGLRLQRVASTGRVIDRYPRTATVITAGAGSLWFTEDSGRLVRLE